MGKLEEKKLFSSDQICIWNYQALLSENLRVQFPPIFQNYPISESEQNIYLIRVQASAQRFNDQKAW
jgi:hypothetical protein